MISRTYDIIGIWYHSQYHVIFILISCMISCMISWSCIYDIKNLWYHRSMISEHTNMISYMIFRMCIPTSKNALGRALLKSLLAAWSSASSKSVTVICRPPRQGPARPLRLTLPDPDRQCAISCQWVPVSPPPAAPLQALPRPRRHRRHHLVDAPALQRRRLRRWRRKRGGVQQAHCVPSAETILESCLSGKPWMPCPWSRWAYQGLLFPSWSWTGSLQEITTQLGSLHAGSIPAHNLYNYIGRTSNWFDITAGLPAGEWNW